MRVVKCVVLQSPPCHSDLVNSSLSARRPKRGARFPGLVSHSGAVKDQLVAASRGARGVTGMEAVVTLLCRTEESFVEARGTA